MKTKDIKKALLTKRKKEVLTAKDFLSTGSTLLNLACTGFPNRGFVKGRYYFIVGDSTSGKTWLSLTCLAEASINPNFKDYRFIYDNAEDGALMDITRFQLRIFIFMLMMQLKLESLLSIFLIRWTH